MFDVVEDPIKRTPDLRIFYNFYQLSYQKVKPMKREQPQQFLFTIGSTNENGIKMALFSATNQ
jgi:hypothetical protein